MDSENQPSFRISIDHVLEDPNLEIQNFKTIEVFQNYFRYTDEFVHSKMNLSKDTRLKIDIPPMNPEQIYQFSKQNEMIELPSIEEFLKNMPLRTFDAQIIFVPFYQEEDSSSILMFHPELKTLEIGLSFFLYKDHTLNRFYLYFLDLMQEIPLFDIQVEQAFVQQCSKQIDFFVYSYFQKLESVLKKQDSQMLFEFFFPHPLPASQLLSSFKSIEVKQQKRYEALKIKSFDYFFLHLEDYNENKV